MPHHVPAGATDLVGVRTIRKVRVRLLPYIFLCYAIAYLDRVNVGFAALEMNRDLALSDAAYAFGAGLFFWGYALLEVPSNLILARVGARVWIARIMIGWGVVSSAMMFISGPWSFAAFRLALGVAEAGFFPGMILYLTYWFPTVERAKAVAFFMTATALTGVIGGPLSGLLMQLDGALGLRGWQWLFLLEGFPAIVLGVTTLYYLTDRPEQASWLAPDERDWLIARLASEKTVETHAHSFGAALRSPILWLFCAIYFCNNVGFYGLTFWLPKIVQNFSGLGTLGTTMLTALPYLCAVIVMVSVAMHSDLRRERRKHVAAVSATGAVGLLLASQAGTPTGGLLALCVTACGIWSVMGPFWALVTATLSNTAAAGGIAFINSVGNLGGFFGPQVIAFAHQRTHDYSTALAFLAIAPATLAVLVLLVPTRKAEPGTRSHVSDA
jgi:ACS family tartrate transporter-like MFS transporter